MNYAEFAMPSAQVTQRVAATSTSTAVTVTASVVFVTATAACFANKNAAAVVQTSFYLAPNIPYKVRGLKDGDTLNFVTVGAATADVYVTPDA